MKKMSLSENFDIATTIFRVTPGESPNLDTRDPAWAGDEERSEKKRKKQAGKILEDSVEELAELQELLYASDTWSVLVVFQALDAAGKDGAIKHVMSGVNPQGVEVTSFKEPSSEDLEHTFLWRCMKKIPERGRIGIFNRSYYEEVLIVRVHPELLEAQRIPNVHAENRTWRDRFDDINAFEKHLARNGTKIIKFFLHVSKEEQKNRFLDRINRPDKHWKFAGADIKERQYFAVLKHLLFLKSQIDNSSKRQPLEILHHIVDDVAFTSLFIETGNIDVIYLAGLLANRKKLIAFLITLNQFGIDNLDCDILLSVLVASPNHPTRRTRVSK